MLRAVPPSVEAGSPPPPAPAATLPPTVTTVAALAAAAGSADAGDRRERVGAVVALVVHAATGLHIDPTGPWTAAELLDLGLDPALAADIAFVLDGSSPADVAPRPDAPDLAAALAPALPLPSPALAGLSPLGVDPADRDGSDPAPRGWRRWVRAGRGRTPPGPTS